MKNGSTILIAEDDPLAQRVVKDELSSHGYDVLTSADGREAWQIMSRDDGPAIAVLDWMLPSIEGIDVCRMVRKERKADPIYIILLTAKGKREEIIEGLQAGADDYVTKPFDVEELFARVQVGQRILGLQHALADRVAELEASMSREKHLRGLLPMCSYCKKVRDDDNYWQQVEQYISKHSDAEFSHGVCPECYESIVKPQIDALG